MRRLCRDCGARDCETCEVIAEACWEEEEKWWQEAFKEMDEVRSDLECHRRGLCIEIECVEQAIENTLVRAEAERLAKCVHELQRELEEVEGELLGQGMLCV